MLALVAGLVAVLGTTCSGYFAYIGGVQGRPDQSVLRPASFLTMLLALVGIVVLGAEIGAWSSEAVFPQIGFIVVLIIVASMPIGLYRDGCNEREKRLKEAQEKRAA